ncbi:family 16 glycoside hydrolase [Chitinophaga niabensis]|uniref:family 16 glycoside hydrolase n=1 Tax=Chitinophaga niabensis TaxID=536979 RepID=UPI0031B9FE1D
MVLRSKNSFLSRSWIGFLYVCGAGLTITQPAFSQSGQIPLQDFSSFKNPSSSWQIAGDVSASLLKPNVLNTAKGTGILVNMPGKKAHGEDLYSNLEHGDMDLELDYMMASGSNSGIYFQGRYEFQLLDSWGVRSPKPGDNGGIYERWDDSKPEGQKGYQGYAPRQNSSKAPGLWQHLKVSFQAPRFDASGKKTENARIIRAELNGVVIHENLELMGPTRGSIGGGDEKATGPLRIQGDHGAVAFKNIQIKQFDQPIPELSNLQYSVYKGRYDANVNLAAQKAEAQGSVAKLTANAGPLSQEYQILYKGTLKVKAAGEYTFVLNGQGGAALVKINNQVVVPFGQRGGKANLSAGDLPVEIIYGREGDRGNPALGISIAGPGIREFYTGDAITPDDTDPILVTAETNTILRSFMDIGNRTRVVHAVSVGSPEKLHYTYDLDKGMIVQLWRGDFLETTPMWHERGNGTARAQGVKQLFGMPYFTLGRLASQQDAWKTDSAGTSYRPKGYVLDEKDRPTFKYQIFGSNVTDVIRVSEDGHGISREITVTEPAGDLYAKLAEGTQIEAGEKDQYVIDGKQYYLQLLDAGGAKPVVRDAGNRKELIIPVKGKLSYSILF